MIYLIDYLSDQVEDEHLLAAMSLMGTIGLMLAVGYLLMYFVRMEEDSLRAQGFILSYQGKLKAIDILKKWVYTIIYEYKIKW